MTHSPPASDGVTVLPDWPALHQELQRKSVTLILLWQEYRQVHPAGYGYSRFCELYQRWAGTLDPVLRQVHLPGAKMFVDWAGQTVPIHHAPDGSVWAAQVFVAVLGASNKTYAEAFANQQLAAWITAHCHAYAFFEGVAKVTVPENPKTGVVRACRYEPVLHRSYQEMAEHYGTVILPARPRRPRAKANIDYHVAVEKHYYSAPSSLIHQTLEVRLTDKMVELFHQGKRVAAHLRNLQPGRFTTLAEHRPKSHQKHLEWTPSRILAWGKTIGPECGQLVQKIMENRPHPEQGFRSALGIIRLAKAFGHDRLEAACRRALHFGACSYGSVQSILKKNLETQPLEQELPLPSPAHENLRGGPYYT